MSREAPAVDEFSLREKGRKAGSSSEDAQWPSRPGAAGEVGGKPKGA